MVERRKSLRSFRWVLLSMDFVQFFLMSPAGSLPISTETSRYCVECYRGSDEWSSGEKRCDRFYLICCRWISYIFDVSGGNVSEFQPKLQDFVLGVVEELVNDRAEKSVAIGLIRFVVDGFL